MIAENPSQSRTADATLSGSVIDLTCDECCIAASSESHLGSGGNDANKGGSSDSSYSSQHALRGGVANDDAESEATFVCQPCLQSHELRASGYSSEPLGLELAHTTTADSPSHWSHLESPSQPPQRPRGFWPSWLSLPLEIVPYWCSGVVPGERTRPNLSVTQSRSASHEQTEPHVCDHDHDLLVGIRADDYSAANEAQATQDRHPPWTHADPHLRCDNGESARESGAQGGSNLNDTHEYDSLAVQNDCLNNVGVPPGSSVSNQDTDQSLTQGHDVLLKVCFVNEYWLDPTDMAPFRKKYVFILHLFSGHRRQGDVQWFLERIEHHEEFTVATLSLDIVIDEARGNLLSNRTIYWWKLKIQQGWMIGLAAGPPCETWSAARWQPPGPEPLRTQQEPWGFSNLSLKQYTRVAGANFLLRAAYLLAAELTKVRGMAMVEHRAPAVWEERAPSHFHLPEVQALLDLRCSEYFQFDQCEHGQYARKPTGLMLLRMPGLPAKLSNTPGRGKCSHGGHPPLKGCNKDGTYKTYRARLYPASMCHCVAQEMSEQAKSAYSTEIPLRPQDLETLRELEKLVMPLDGDP